jgi:hypothetical protein
VRRVKRSPSNRSKFCNDGIQDRSDSTYAIMIGKAVQTVQKRQITGYAYKVAKGMMPKISGES